MSAAKFTGAAAPADGVGADPTASVRRTVVQSVGRAFDVLDVLKAATAPMSALEVARASGLDRTVVHRLLRSVSERGMAVEERGRFRLGPQSVLLANRYLDNLLVRRLALPYMVELQTTVVADRPNTVSLSIPIGDVITVIERIWTPSAPLGVVLETGDTNPIDRSAAGRAMLAYYEEKDARAVLGDDRYGLIADALARVRDADGVGTAHNEVHQGLDGVAAVIRSRRAQPIAAIAISGPDLGDELADDSSLAGHLRRAAATVGQSIP